MDRKQSDPVGTTYAAPHLRGFVLTCTDVKHVGGRTVWHYTSEVGGVAFWDYFNVVKAVAPTTRYLIEDIQNAGAVILSADLHTEYTCKWEDVWILDGVSDPVEYCDAAMLRIVLAAGDGATLYRAERDEDDDRIVIPPR